MKILFLGDSITEGIPGVPFIPMIQSNYRDSSLINRGVGGDTVSSLFKRVTKMNDLSTFDYIVLFIGVNDVFGKLTKTFKILKTLKRQRWSKDVLMFKKQYNDLLTHILSENKNIIIIPPLLIGENLDNKWNIELISYIEAISEVSKNKNLTFLNIHDQFKEYLYKKQINDYLPLKVSEIYKDVKRLTNPSLVDQKSKDRGLHLTLDGVHINTLGAKMISQTISDFLNTN